jgi:GT2 family glycosyltransferase
MMAGMSTDRPLATPVKPRAALTGVGVVVIGRNEGERLRRCLSSLAASGVVIVYVDSGSNDGSVEWARARCRAVVDLDATLPFTAARARNAGFERLVELLPSVEFVQFVDGDCEVDPAWLERAVRELEGEPRRAVVCGRRRERYPQRSTYNRLCDVEWDTPVGVATACGGDSMMRARAFREVGGFNPALLAGEEPELCVRLRQRGWTIFRVDAEMTLHDAAMTRFGQWWRRGVRAGYGYAQGRALHGRAPERLYVRKSRSILVSGLLVPVAAVAMAPATRGLSLALLAWYPLRIARFARVSRRRGLAPGLAWTYSAFCMLANFPILVGWARCVASRTARQQPQLIEYKDVA